MNMSNNTQILSAEEARQETNKEIQNDDSDLLPIMELVKKSIKRKEFYCNYTGILKDYTKEKLQGLGYKLQYMKGGGDQREPDYYVISWVASSGRF